MALTIAIPKPLQIAHCFWTFSAPVLYKDFQRTWPERQYINQIPVTISFLEAIAGVINKDFYFHQAKRQYLEDSSKSIDVVVFGHTHIPDFRRTNDGFYINAGTWIDHNTSYPEATRTFAVIKTGAVDSAAVYEYTQTGALLDISESLST